MSRGTFVLLLILLLRNAAAQDTAVPFDLRDCIQYVLKNGNGIEQAQLEAQKAEYQVQEMKSQALPNLQVNSDIAYHFARPVTLAPAGLFDGQNGDVPIRFGKNIFAGVNIEARQPLFTPVFAVGEEGREKLVRVNELQVQRSREQAVLEVAKTYYQALIVKKKRGLLEANLNRIEGLLKLTRRQYQNGFAKEIDVNRLEVARKNLETKLRNLDLQYDRLLHLLKYRMSLPLEEDIQLPDSLNTAPYAIPEAARQTLNLDQRTEINLLRLRGELQQLQIERLRAGNLPSIYLQAALRLNAWGDTPAEWLRTDYWFGNSYLGLRVEYNLFDGYERRAKIQQAQLETELAEHQLQSTRQSLQLQHYSARQQLQMNYNELQSLEENLNMARRIFEVTEKQYSEGITPIMELLSAEASLREAQTNFLTALLELRQAEVELWHAKGELIARMTEN